MITKQSLEEVNKSLVTVGIEKGKKKTNYVMVNERVKAFRNLCPGGSITTDIISLDNGVVTMKATVADEDGNVLSTGLAQEKETSSFINKTSFIENCETSAVGRALGFAGIGIDGSMASAEEVANAIMNQGQTAHAEIPDQSKTARQFIDDIKVQALTKKCINDKVNGAKLCELYKVEKFTQLTEKMFVNMMANWDKVREQCN